MKKKLLLFVVAILSATSLTLSSCGSDDDDTLSFVQNASFDANLLFGRWDIEYRDEPSKKSFWYDLKDIRMTFSKDGTFNVKYETNEYEDCYLTTTYRISGDTITIGGNITITIESIDEYDVYFLAKYNNDNGYTDTMYCKGKKR